MKNNGFFAFSAELSGFAKNFKYITRESLIEKGRERGRGR
jgi:hypothetical protein